MQVDEDSSSDESEEEVCALHQPGSHVLTVYR